MAQAFSWRLGVGTECCLVETTDALHVSQVSIGAHDLSHAVMERDGNVNEVTSS